MKTEHHARLTLHDFDGMSDRKKRELFDWLRTLASDLEDSEPNTYAKVFTARLMK